MLAATTLLSAPAMAAPVFMLQFGSFETREEADKRLNDLKSQHAGVIGSMQSGIREVTLPPDNLTVYRTQAGPVETRATAQSICGQLASNGDECYVVETAMAQGFAAPTQVAQATTAPAPAAAPVAAAPAPAPLTVAQAATSTKPVMPMAPAPLRDPSSMSTAALITPGASTTAPQAVPPVAMSPVPMRDPSNAAAINRITGVPTTMQTNTAAPMTVAAAAPTPAPAASPSMQKAMDKAAAEQNEMDAKRASAPTPADAKEEGTFWSRLNPFSSDEPKKVAAAPAPVLAKPVTVETPVVETPVVVTPQVVPPAPAPVLAAPAPLSPLPQSMPPMAVAPAPSASPLLPPPPAPTLGRGAIPANNEAASLRAPAPVIVPEPTGTLQTPAPIVIGDNTGNVRVGEAQRVPLSQATVPQPVMALPAPPMAAAIPAPGPALSPSSNLGVKTLWAHVGQFADAQSALAFWDQYRRSHPDFPVVRVRVTSPLQSLNHGNDKVSLRVGPFAKEASIRTLCTTIQQQQAQVKTDRLICGSIVDMGISSRVGGARNGFLPGSRYQR